MMIHVMLFVLGSIVFMLGGFAAITGQPKETVLHLNLVAVVVLLSAIYCKLP